MKKRCAACGRPIKRALTWDGQDYGIECWKKIALPAIEAQREARKQAKFERWGLYCQVVVEVLKAKDMTKIKNQWKRDFITSIIQQYEERGFLSRKQVNLATDQFNGKDGEFYVEIKRELGLVDEIGYHVQMATWARKGREYHNAKAAMLIGNATDEQKALVGEN